MAPRVLLMGLTGWLLLPLTAAAGPLPPLKRSEATASVLSFLTNTSIDGLAGALRGYLVHNLPPTLYEASPGWGTQKMVTRGIKWKGQGLHVHPEVMKSARNDGTWRRIKFTADNLKDTLIFDIRNVQQPEPGRLTFDVFIAFDAQLDYDQENWSAGTRLYAGSTRARLRIKCPLQCEATTRIEKGAKLLPDAIIRLRVVQANLQYDNLVVEHVAGVGGEAARLLGDSIKGGMRQWHPSLEHDFLAKADAAIVKAADTKEVRVSLSNLLGK